MFKSRELRAQARQDYDNARGTAHKQLLLQAQEALKLRQNTLEQTVAAAEAKLQRLHDDCEKDLQSILARHLVEQHLHELPGIGRTLSDEVLRRVFRGSLSDLHFASMVSGIGTTKQSEISAWVRDYQRQIPTLLRNDFPGKKERQARRAQEEVVWKARIETTSEQLAEIRYARGQAEKQLELLQSITPATFVKIQLGEAGPTKEVDQYINGVFAPWEKVPDWFQNVLDLAGSEPYDSTIRPEARQGASELSPTGLLLVIFVIVALVVALLLQVAW